MKKRLITILAALVVLTCLPLSVFAREVPDLSRKGSVEITMMTGGTAVPGGTLRCTRVGDVAEDDGNYSFVRLDGGKLEDVTSPEAAAALETFAAEYGKTHTLKTAEKEIDANGKVRFAELEPGLYLITQPKPAPGYCAIKPFLVGLPEMNGDTCVYDREIRSKTEPEKAAAPTATPTPTPVPGTTLPQTGQLNWPIPVLTAAGLVLLALGLLLRGGKRKGRHEA